MRTVLARSYLSSIAVSAGSKRSWTVSGEVKYDGQACQEAKTDRLHKDSLCEDKGFIPCEDKGFIPCEKGFIPCEDVGLFMLETNINSTQFLVQLKEGQN